MQQCRLLQRLCVSASGDSRDLYTPLFVISRFVGWLAHNIEHKQYDDRIVRPAAKYVGEIREYIPMEDR